MKKLLLLPLVLFVMLIAAMVNPFGCREKKEVISGYGSSYVILNECMILPQPEEGYWMISGLVMYDDTLFFVDENSRIVLVKNDTILKVIRGGRPYHDYKLEMISGPKAGN